MEGTVTGLFFNHTVSLLFFAACVQTAFTVNARDLKILWIEIYHTEAQQIYRNVWCLRSSKWKPNEWENPLLSGLKMSEYPEFGSLKMGVQVCKKEDLFKKWEVQDSALGILKD